MPRCLLCGRALTQRHAIGNHKFIYCRRAACRRILADRHRAIERARYRRHVGHPPRCYVRHKPYRRKLYRDRRQNTR